MAVKGVSERFDRFARAHLGDRALRAIYAVMAADPAAEWTVGEVAVHAKVSHHEADQALRRFAAAGIVAHMAAPGRPHRYQWALTADDPAEVDIAGREQAIDPVCGMSVPAGSRHVARDGDREVRFCSLPCLVRWNAASTTRRRRPAAASGAPTRRNERSG